MIGQQYKAALLIFLLGLASWKIYNAGYDSAEGKYKLSNSQSETKQAQDAVVLSENNRQEEKRREEIVEITDNGSIEQTSQLNADLAESNQLNDSLRKQLTRLQIRQSGSEATCDARITQQRETREAQFAVLTELYAGAEGAATVFAAEADAARNKGLRCEAIYDGVRGVK